MALRERHHGGTGAWYRALNDPCRCDTCRIADRAYQADRRHRNTLRARRGEVSFTHGRHGYSHYGCRCATCEGTEIAYRTRRKLAMA